MNDPFEPGHKGEPRDPKTEIRYEHTPHRDGLIDQAERGSFGGLSGPARLLGTISSIIHQFKRSGQVGEEMAKEAQRRNVSWSSADPQPHRPTDEEADAGTIDGPGGVQ